MSRFFSSYAGWKFFDLWLDGVREGGRIVSVAAIIAVAANTDGRREIVGLGIGPSEAEPWATPPETPVKRRLTGVKLVISDAQEGLKAAPKGDRRQQAALPRSFPVHFTLDLDDLRFILDLGHGLLPRQRVGDFDHHLRTMTTSLDFAELCAHYRSVCREPNCSLR